MHALYGFCTIVTFIFGLMAILIALELHSTGGFWVRPSRWRKDVREHLVGIAIGLIVVALVTGGEVWVAPPGEWPSASVLGVSISFFLAMVSDEDALGFQAWISRRMKRLRLLSSFAK